MKRIAYHPSVHPAKPWCVFETTFENADASRLPKIELFASRRDAQESFPDAIVDEEFAWECGLRVESSEEH
ncbi:MAG: hypothetical protein QOC81_682 [Thermoanaerobaculia bacterium]|jgi:hypothetical protein|nr:hypothetical protein [Thermoanaerobaculia bacterium]